MLQLFTRGKKTEKTGSGSLLNRPSCLLVDQIGQGTELNWAEGPDIGLHVSPIASDSAIVLLLLFLLLLFVCLSVLFSSDHLVWFSWSLSARIALGRWKVLHRMRTLKSHSKNPPSSKIPYNKPIKHQNTALHAFSAAKKKKALVFLGDTAASLATVRVWLWVWNAKNVLHKFRVKNITG